MYSEKIREMRRKLYVFRDRIDDPESKQALTDAIEALTRFVKRRAELFQERMRETLAGE